MLRPFNYCIIDEVDSILIDEARTPLIISGALPPCSLCTAITMQSRPVHAQEDSCRIL